ncbi:hypothetical protein DESC_940027 [Desulfosarcina cetonica]|nr:hypothetical protein DESC_940027 [Desulfosarcina cetonica]
MRYIIVYTNDAKLKNNNKSNAVTLNAARWLMKSLGVCLSFRQDICRPSVIIGDVPDRCSRRPPPGAIPRRLGGGDDLTYFVNERSMLCDNSDSIRSKQLRTPPFIAAG